MCSIFLIWHDIFNFFFEIYELKQFLDICVVEKYFIKNKIIKSFLIIVIIQHSFWQGLKKNTQNRAAYRSDRFHFEVYRFDLSVIDL